MTQTFRDTRARAALTAHIAARGVPVQPTIENHHGCRTRLSAEAAAAKAGGPNVVVRAVPRPCGTWVPVVCLRKDQLWSRPHVEERGAVCEVI